MQNKPNVLVFFTDQQRHDTCGCYGQRLPVTPVLDAMAAQGVCFEQAYTCQPVCGPARAALQTGLWPTQTGCYRNGIGLPPGTRTLADEMHDLGYQTAYCGKWHLATDDNASYETLPVPPERRGGYRDDWVASDVLEFTSHGYGGHMFEADGSPYRFTGYRADAVTDAALRFLCERRDPERPFFQFISHIEPHHQNDRNHFEGPRGSKARWKDHDVPPDLDGKAGDWQAEYPDYLGCCNRLDTNLGRVLDALSALGILEETLVIFASDHGCHFRTRNDEYKRACHDNATHIPLILRGPGFLGGQRVPHLVSLLDIPATILAVGGGATPMCWPSRPLQDALAQDVELWDTVYMQISESHVGRALRTPRYKYEVAAPWLSGVKDATGDTYMETCLYDLWLDPTESRNLAQEPGYADVRAELAVRMAAFITRAEGIEVNIYNGTQCDAELRF